MSEPTTNPSSAPPGPKREFAFSRIAGASPSEYAAVSRSAVAAVIAALFSWLGLIWAWGLVAPALGLALSGAAFYYIATSAGTLTGRRVVWVAIALCVAVGGAGAVVQLKAYRDRQQAIATARGLARHGIELIEKGDWAAFYVQVAPDFNEAVPSAYWNYTWNRWLGDRGELVRIEMHPRARYLERGLILVSLRFYMHPKGAPAGVEEMYPVRLIYKHWSAEDIEAFHAKEAERLGLDHGVAHSWSAHGEPGWRLSNIPGVVRALPPPYAGPLAWPAPGPTEQIVLLKQAGAVAIRVIPPGRTAPPLDAAMQELTATLALPPLVPPLSADPSLDYGPPTRGWLTRRPRRPRPRHHH